MGVPVVQTDSLVHSTYQYLSEIQAVQPCSEQIAIFRSPSLWHLTTRLNSSPGATKLGPVGPALLTVLLKRQSNAIL